MSVFDLPDIDLSITENESCNDDKCEITNDDEKIACFYIWIIGESDT